MAALKRTLTAACALLALGMTACTTTSNVEVEAVRLEQLAPQELGQGACGLFLWARATPQPILVLAAFANPAEARIRIDGRDRALRRTTGEGEVRFGHFSVQTFADDSLTIQTDVEFSVSRPMRDGAAIDGGVIRLRDADGWETIIPVTGLLACQT